MPHLQEGPHLQESPQENLGAPSGRGPGARPPRERREGLAAQALAPGPEVVELVRFLMVKDKRKSPTPRSEMGKYVI